MQFSKCKGHSTFFEVGEGGLGWTPKMVYIEIIISTKNQIIFFKPMCIFFSLQQLNRMIDDYKVYNFGIVIT